MTSWLEPACPLFVADVDDPFVCAYDGMAYEAHSSRSQFGAYFGASPDEARNAQRLTLVPDRRTLVRDRSEQR